MSKRKVHHEEHADETWLLPYSDLLTLLLALFIVMFAISNVDKEKAEKLSAQFNAIFFDGGAGLMEKEGAVIPMPEPIVLPDPMEKITSETSSGTVVVNYAKIEDDKMVEIKRDIEGKIKNNGYSDNVKVVVNEDGLEISIQDVLLFNSGNAEILSGIHPLLLQVSKLLDNLDNKIKIVGHTDNIPIRSGKYRSNWELSAMRAINVMNFLVENGKLNPARFSIQGYGQYAPKFDNATEAGRAKNRRVDICLVRKYTQKSEDKDK